MGIFLKTFQLRQMLAQAVVGRTFVVFAVSENAVMSTTQRYEVIMHLADDTCI